MVLADILTMLTNRLQSLNNSKVSAELSGNIVEIERLSGEIADTESALDKVRSLII